MHATVSTLLTQLDIVPILVDIGASGAPPSIWKPIAPLSVRIAFDPDLREMRDERDGHFRRSVVVNEAVIPSAAAGAARFYLTKFPFASSTLEPEPAHVVHWLNSDQFDVERTTNVKATTIDTVLARLGLPTVDWIKTDSQGTDLRLFNSIAADTRARVLAMDIEPGFIEVYRNEDLFVDVHDDLTRNGFWLSSLDAGGFIRMRRETLQAARAIDPRFDEAFVQNAVLPSPAYACARYLRTLEWLTQHSFGPREYALLWAFAVMDHRLGFALDVIVGLEKTHGESDLSSQLREATGNLLRRAYRRRQARRALTRVTRPIIGLAHRLL